MKTFSLAIVCLSLVSPFARAQAPAAGAMKATVEKTEKIWDRGKHNGYPDITRFQNLWYCCLREADGNAAGAGNGFVRVLASYDLKEWSSVAEIKEDGVDLRDPKFCPTKEDRLFIVAGGSVMEGNVLKSRRSRVVTSTDGKHWSPPVKTLSDGDWLWRAVINPADGKYYGVSYNAYPTTGGPKFEPEWTAKLYTSVDQKAWSLAAPFDVKGQPNECTVRILKDGSMMALLRRESRAPDVMMRGMVGSAPAPFRKWTWKELTVPLRGPNFIELPDGRLVAGSGGFGATPGVHMVLFEMTAAGVKPLVELPSSGDCSFPGMHFEDGKLYVSYHSTHEGKTSIYLSRVKID